MDHDDPIEEVFEDQLACADLVVLSKSDLVTVAQLAEIETTLKAILNKYYDRLNCYFFFFCSKTRLAFATCSRGTSKS